MKKLHQPCESFNKIFEKPRTLKGQGHVTVNKIIISMIYIVAGTWPLCCAQILVDGVNLQ